MLPIHQRQGILAILLFPSTISTMHCDRKPSPLGCCLQLFQTALDQLQVGYTSEQLERWMLGIHSAMTGRSRNFHQLEHVLKVAYGLRPTQVIAALYHDVVYYQVDQGFSPAIQEKIRGTLVTRDGRFYATSEPGDGKVWLVREVFDLAPGQELNVLGGLNEFLSAVVAIHDLGPLLNDIQVAAVAACIRATIPFRGLDPSGNTFPMRIASALERISKRERWNCTDALIHELVRQAVEMGNADVANFAHNELSVFLDNTWKLLPEANPSLHSLRGNTIKSFRHSLQKMEGFMSQLDPALVFHEFHGFPEMQTYARMKRFAGENILQAVEYLRAKLVTLAILEGIAELTGGDAPIELLAGASKEEDPSTIQIQDFLGEPLSYRTADFDDLDEVVYHLLNVGRTSATHFDSKASPIAAFVYAVLGTSALERCFGAARKAFQGELSWMDFLKSFPGSLVREMVEAVAVISVVRKDRCLELAKRF
jgi:hypothetical protein